jgi:hypothetical protein
VKSLRPEHLQSFWYSASKYSFALIGTFIGLLWATASTEDEAQTYKERLEEYRWTLRLSSKSAEILDQAASLLAMSTGVLVKGIPKKDSLDSFGSPGEDGDQDDVSRESNWMPEHSLPDDISMQTSPTQFSDAAMDVFWPGIPTNYDVAGGYDIDNNVHSFMGPAI